MEKKTNSSKVIVATSGKGGVGKTTSVANIGSGLAKLGYRVAVMDLDIGLKKLDLILGLENRVIYDIMQVAEGECTLRQALVKDKNMPHFCMLPAAQTRNKEDLKPEQIKKICAELREDFDFILIDCPAGIEQGFRNAISAADAAIVVTNPEISAVRDADRITGILESEQFDDISLLINRLRPDMVKQGDMLSIADLQEHLALRLIGVVPEDSNVLVSTNRGEPMVLEGKSPAAKAFSNVVQRIIGNEIDIMSDFEMDNQSFWSRFRKGFFSRK